MFLEVGIKGKNMLSKKRALQNQYGHTHTPHPQLVQSASNHSFSTAIFHLSTETSTSIVKQYSGGHSFCFAFLVLSTSQSCKGNLPCYVFLMYKSGESRVWNQQCIGFECTLLSQPHMKILLQNILRGCVQHREQFLENNAKFSDTLPKVLGQRKRNRDLSRSV